MIDRCYKHPFTLRRLAEGSAWPFLDGFAGELLAEGYTLDPCRRHVWTAVHLGEWCSRRGITLADLDEKALAVNMLRQVAQPWPAEVSPC